MSFLEVFVRRPVFTTMLIASLVVLGAASFVQLGVDIFPKVDLPTITITTRLVDTASTPLLLKVLGSRKIDPKLLITHRFKLDRILDAYETFEHAAKTRALKVIIEV